MLTAFGQCAVPFVSTLKCLLTESSTSYYTRLFAGLLIWHLTYLYNRFFRHPKLSILQKSQKRFNSALVLRQTVREHVHVIYPAYFSMKLP